MLYAARISFAELAGFAAIFGGTAAVMAGVASYARRKRHWVLLTALPGTLLIGWTAYRVATNMRTNDRAFDLWFGALATIPLAAQTVVILVLHRLRLSFAGLFILTTVAGMAMAVVLFETQPPIPRIEAIDSATSRAESRADTYPRSSPR